MGSVLTTIRGSLAAVALAAGLGALAGETGDAQGDRREVELELQRQKAQLQRILERLREYQQRLDGAAADLTPPEIEPPDATVLVRSDTDRHGRTVFAVEADRVTLQHVLEALTTEAQLDLLIDQGVSHRHVAALVTMALDGATFREALDLLLGRYGLEYKVEEGHVVVAPPTRFAFQTAAEYLRQKAEQAYRAALVRFPDHADAPRAYLLLGRHFCRRRLYPQAVEHLKRLIRDYPRSDQVPAAFFALGQAYEALGEPTKAAQAYSSVVSDYRTSPFTDDALLALARRAVADGRPAEALPLLDEVVKGHAGGSARPEAELLLGETLVLARRYDVALRHLERLLAQGLTPAGERRVRLLMARTLAAQGETGRARRAAYELRRRFPESPEGEEAYYLLADTYYQETTPESCLAAIEAYRGAVRRAAEGPQAGRARLRLAALYQRITLYDLAVREYEALLADHPSTIPRRAILRALGECFREKGNYQKAQLCFERAAEGDDADAWRAAMHAGRAALADGRPADAVPFFERVAQHAGEPALTAEAHEAAGDCYRRLGKLEEALVAYQRAAATPVAEGPASPKTSTREPTAEKDTDDATLDRADP